MLSKNNSASYKEKILYSNAWAQSLSFWKYNLYQIEKNVALMLIPSKAIITDPIVCSNSIWINTAESRCTAADSKHVESASVSGRKT